MAKAKPLAGLSDRADQVISPNEPASAEALLDAARVAVLADSNEGTRQFWTQQCGMPDNLTFEEGRVWAENSQAERNAEERVRATQLANFEKLLESRCQQRMFAAGFNVEEMQGMQLPSMPSYVSAADPRMPAFKAAMKERELDELAMARALGWATGQNQAAQIEGPAKLQHEGQIEDVSAKSKRKRSSERGEAQAKLIAALTKHHQYGKGGCLNFEPIGNNELARLANVDKATASAFFKQKFGRHRKYKTDCANPSRLVAQLKLLNGEFSPYHLSRSIPADSVDRVDD